MEIRPDINTLYKARLLIGDKPNITPNIEQAAIQSIIQAEEEVCLNRLTQPETGVSKLRALRREAFLQTRNWVSPAALSAAYLSEQYYQALLFRAQSYRNIGDDPYFVVAFDASWGVSLTLSTVSFASEGLRMGHQRFMVEMIRNAGERVNRSSPMYAMMDREQLNKERLLDNEPTGFDLVEEAVKVVKREPNKIEDRVAPRPVFVPDYLSKGAEASARLYKATYAIANKLPEPPKFPINLNLQD